MVGGFGGVAVSHVGERLPQALLRRGFALPLLLMGGAIAFRTASTFA